MNGDTSVKLITVIHYNTDDIAKVTGAKVKVSQQWP